MPPKSVFPAHLFSFFVSHSLFIFLAFFLFFFLFLSLFATTKVTVWCGINWDFGLIWYANFEDKHGKRVNVNSQNYIECLKFYKKEVNRRMGKDARKYVLIQDGASSHLSKETRLVLTKLFGKNFIDKNSASNRRDELEWSPTSADCNPCDYGLWSDIEDLINADLLMTREELKKRIEEVFKPLENDLNKIEKIIRSFKDRCQMVVDSEGGATNYRKWRNEQKKKEGRKRKKGKRGMRKERQERGMREESKMFD